jgi:putative oxidoreductase
MSTLSQAVSSQSIPSSQEQPRSRLRNASELFGRVLLASLFLLSGFGKISAYSATAGYIASVGVPGALLPLVIVMELLGSLALILGWQTRVVSLLLAGFTLVAGALFHNNFADQIQMVMFFKNVAIAGALLMLAANGAGRLSLDRSRAKGD